MKQLLWEEMIIKDIILYIDMDGVINLFENDKFARKNMWLKDYFINIEPRKNIKNDLLEISEYVNKIVILTKCINRAGVQEEKDKFIEKHHLNDISNLSVQYVPYCESKASYIDANSYTVLLDDNLQNLIECKSVCDVCVYFNENNVSPYEFTTINNIRELVDVLKNKIK